MNLTSYRQLAKAKYPSITEADFDRLLAQVCNLPRLELFLNAEREITNAEETTMNAFLQRRSENEPLQYIFGEAPFRDFMLNVGEGVLIPRPETEMLVDLALKYLPENASVCDLGTGSAAIAISIALEKPDAKVTAVDISDLALKFARQNIEKYQVKNITLLHSDLFAEIHDQKFNLISANLPYVAQKIYENLDCEVRSFEPGLALLSGSDGLDLIRKTVTESKFFLIPDGKIILEFSPEQDKTILDILMKNNYRDVEIIQDLNKRARFAVATLNGNT